VDPTAARRLQLPPVTLPELFQNAVKHNDLSGPSFSITVRLVDRTLIVCNDRRPYAGRRSASTGTGLSNLSQRFRLFVGQEIAWRSAEDRFEVRLPLLEGSGPTAPATTAIRGG
jgi:LytS/YehU family sensor histidine kinase